MSGVKIPGRTNVKLLPVPLSTRRNSSPPSAVHGRSTRDPGNISEICARMLKIMRTDLADYAQIMRTLFIIIEHRSSAIADKPRDAFMQCAIAWLTP